MERFLSWMMLVLMPVAAIAVAIIIPIVLVSRWRRSQKRLLRKSPLTRELLRSPGHSLSQEIDEVEEDLSNSITVLFVVPFALISIHVCDSYYRGTPESFFRYAVGASVLIIASVFFGRRIIKSLGQRRNLVLGMEGELATGQELDQLMLDGCRVFHDIKARHGNIDNVVVSHSGVFCVETKMISKYKVGHDKAEVVVDHDQNVMRFANFEREIPSAQIESQTRWLSEFLSSATGETVRAEGMLALPGYCIAKRIGKGSVYVFSPVRPLRFFANSRKVLSDQQIKRISHQLEQLCRDVQPSFQDDPNWEKA
jgi:Nuclease-related domain